MPAYYIYGLNINGQQVFLRHTRLYSEIDAVKFSAMCKEIIEAMNILGEPVIVEKVAAHLITKHGFWHYTITPVEQFHYAVESDPIDEPLHKWIVLLKVFDQQLSSEWHSGSCISLESQAGFESKEDAEAWLQEVMASRYKNDTDRYTFTPCFLRYDETHSQNVEVLLKNL